MTDKILGASNVIIIDSLFSFCKMGKNMNSLNREYELNT